MHSVARQSLHVGPQLCASVIEPMHGVPPAPPAELDAVAPPAPAAPLALLAVAAGRSTSRRLQPSSADAVHTMSTILMSPPETLRRVPAGSSVSVWRIAGKRGGGGAHGCEHRPP